MNIKAILDKSVPITPGDKGCRFKLEAKNKLRAEVQQMIEQYVKENNKSSDSRMPGEVQTCQIKSPS